MMVYLYGGSYQHGANIMYPGHFLAAEGVVVVIPNYRTGNLGRYAVCMFHKNPSTAVTSVTSFFLPVGQDCLYI